LIALLNWGLGLIFGAIFARKIGEQAQERQIPLNYPLVGAAGYAGLLVWHGGLSGSAPLKAAGTDSLIEQAGAVPLSETLFSPMNGIVSLLLLVALPLLMYYLGRKSATPTVPDVQPSPPPEKDKPQATGADRIEYSRTFAYLVALLMIGTGVYQIWQQEVPSKLNLVNFFLFGAGLLLHGGFAPFQQAAGEAVKSATGIIIQFPLYAGIMGIMKYTGLIEVFSQLFEQVSTTTTFPLFTFISGAVVNFFVPSGGGQWAVQGPLIAEAAQHIGAPFAKCIMALSYGDQLTNMMQPFWALPLLGITGLKARDILPYTLLMMGAGTVIFLFGLILF
jgi:short-chain fatty acids transporter